MAIHYHCRHCGVQMGSVYQHVLEAELGLNRLTAEEKNEMTSYDDKGDLHIRSICEDCQKGLEEHPEYYERDYFIH
jgi:hypothetical protein